MARPTKLNDELQAAIVELVKAGDAPEVAAGTQGIGRATYFEWMARGEQGLEPFASFRTLVACARDTFESNARQVIMSGDEIGVGFGPAKAALEVLSRRMPARWSQRVRVQVEESDQLKLEALRRVCSDQEIYARVRQAENLLPVLVRFCEELARLDSEGDAGPDHERAGVH